ncbi:MAG: tetratricopeptide repeat protein [Planctomycetes bacterium]|nr:tetratricopeptide repeat protein [Planctomycetota bacterium]
MSALTDARTGDETNLGEFLASLVEHPKTGTFKLSGPDGRVKYIYFKRGTIELLKTMRSKTLLGKALLKRRKLTTEQLEAALERQKAANSNLRLGEILVGMGIVLESDVHQALAYQIAEEVFELFTWPEIRSEFYRGEPPLDIFEVEDLQARVSLSPIQLAREAVRRKKELSEIQRTIPSTRDVYVPTPNAYKADKSNSLAVEEVFSCLDGQRNVEELLDVARAPDLVAMRVLVKMKLDGQAVPLAGQELIALGQSLEDRGEFARARSRYLRAEELGYPDFDLPRRIGQIAEALGDTQEACRRYVIYADRCDQSGYPDVAAQTLARVLELDPQQTQARELHAEILAKRARALEEAGEPSAEKTAAAIEEYETLFLQFAGLEDKRRVLTALMTLAPDRLDLRERQGELSLQAGDIGEAIEDFQELAMAYLEAEQLEPAVEVLRRILEVEPGEILALQSLAATYARMGRTGDAVEQYLQFAKTFEDSGLAVASNETLIDIYERIVDLDPQNTEARKFLANAYEGKEEADKSVANYQSMAELLREQGKREELYEVLGQLCALKPGDFELTLERARLASELGRSEEGAALLHQAADAATQTGDSKGALAALKQLLSLAPGNLSAHLALAKHEAQAKEHQAAGRRCAAVFDLAMVAGNHALAEEAVKRAMDHEPDAPEHRERLSRVLVVNGRADEAARTLVRAARRARDDENLGLARQWARKALELDGTCDDARDLLENLRTAPAAPTYGSAERVGERPTIAATITGGPKVASIEGMRTKTRKMGGALHKLKALKSGGLPPPSPDTDKVSPGPEGPGRPAEAQVSRKANSALNKLRALRGSTGSDSGSDGSEETQKVSKGPEAPGEAADPGVAKKATSAMSRLKALKSGSGGGAEPPTPKVSKGPEAPGEAADPGVAKKATSAMSRLKALKSSKGGEKPTPKISKGPEAPGVAADEQVSKKASSAMDRLRALKGGVAVAPDDPAEDS